MDNNLFFVNWHKTTLDRISIIITELLMKNYSDGVNTLVDAMTYSCHGSGKMIRSLLVEATGLISNANLDLLDNLAIIIEIIHSFSLIHDDLPCMDNDDYRRGKMTNHKIFGEDIALLAGDALLVFAFELLSDINIFSNVESKVMLKIINMITKAIGVTGMVGGQALDVSATNQTITYQELTHIHSLKTGSLITVSCLIGYLIGTNFNDIIYQQLKNLADKIGVLFQVVDDIIDTTSSSATLGKTANKDLQNNKATFVTVLGLNQAKDYAQKLFVDINHDLASFPKADYLQYMAHIIYHRNS